MPAPRKRMTDSDNAFFAALERGYTVKAAATLTGCSRQALYRRRITDRAFDQRWEYGDSMPIPFAAPPSACTADWLRAPGQVGQLLDTAR